MGNTVKLIFNVFKLRIGIVIGFTALAGIAVTPGPALAAWQIAVLGLAVLVSSASAGAFNQYYERDLDIQMKRTQRRPFVVGAFNADWRWPALIGAMVVGSTAAAALALNPWAALYTFLGAFFYAIVYTVWLKRRSWMNIVIGGLSGALPPAIGWAAVTGHLSLAPLVLVAIIFMWTPPHFWALALYRKNEYAKAGVPMLPVTHGDRFTRLHVLLYTLILIAVTLLPFATRMSGVLYMVSVVALDAVFLYYAVRIYRDYSDRIAQTTFRYSILYLMLLFTALLLDHYLVA